MDGQKKIPENQFREWIGSLPSRTPAGLDDRIMARVRKATSPAERRSDRRMLVWAIVLGVVVLGAGIGVLSFYVDWSILSETMPSPELPPVPRNTLADSQAWELAKSILPLAGIALILLIGDSLFRRRFFLKHQRENEK